MKTFEKRCPYPPCGKIFFTPNRPQTYCSQTCARKSKTIHTLEDIKAYLLKNVLPPDDPDACWPWQGHVSKSNGYGRACVRRQGISAHRLSYEAFVRSIPEGMHILHVRHCLYRHCINPRHLYCGTAKDNAEDSVAVGHMPHGSSHYKARLNEQKVSEILRKYHNQHVSIQELASAYQVSYPTISAIIRRTHWTHVLPQQFSSPMRTRPRVLTAEDVQSIRILHEDQGVTYAALSRQFHISKPHARKICLREVWRHLP